MLRIALIVNPLAGIGGSVALKGSDGPQLQAEARARSGVPRGEQRASQFVKHLLSQSFKQSQVVQHPSKPGDDRQSPHVTWLAPAGPMGGDILLECGLEFEEIGRPRYPSTPHDTVATVRSAQAADAALIVFVGGDGTARDVLSAVDVGQPVLGIPAGVKMHSGVFAITPIAAAQLVDQLIHGGLVGVQDRQVRDFDGDQHNPDVQSDPNTMLTKYYGDLAVPEIGGFLQQTKVAGIESEPLAVQEIVAEIVEHWRGRNLLVGPGSTCLAIKRALGLDPGTLRGFDSLVDGVWQIDLTGQDIEHILTSQEDKRLHVILSFARGQGFLFGRGNQQLTVEVLRLLDWPRDFTVVGTRTKLLSLEGRPLLLDTNDSTLDEMFAGLISITTGYEDHLLYQVSAQA